MVPDVMSVAEVNAYLQLCGSWRCGLEESWQCVLLGNVGSSCVYASWQCRLQMMSSAWATMVIRKPTLMRLCATVLGSDADALVGSRRITVCGAPFWKEESQGDGYL